jgi:putative transposase
MALEEKRRRLEREPTRMDESIKDRNIRQAKILFARRDRFLDEEAERNCVRLESRTYPMWLSNPNAASIVVASILWGVPDRYDLHAFVVMSNHVHVLLTPAVELSQITQGIKGWTARQINKLSGHKGRQFWQNESYDHWARDEEEMLRIIDYIERNPVTAGLCRHRNQWAWSWSSARWRNELGWQAGDTFQPQWKAAVTKRLSAWKG